MEVAAANLLLPLGVRLVAEAQLGVRLLRVDEGGLFLDEVPLGRLALVAESVHLHHRRRVCVVEHLVDVRLAHFATFAGR